VLRVLTIELTKLTPSESQKGNMQKQNVDQGRKPRLNQRPPRKHWLGGLGVALLLSLALGHAAISYLVPQGPNHAPRDGTRLGWYFHEGQFKADARTLAAAIQFLMGPESNPPALTNYANLPVAENATPGPPKS
jgi:hypothetical protein